MMETNTHDLEHQLSHFCGSVQLHRWNQLSRSVLTDGAKYLADKAGAYWLFDAIDSHLQFEGVNENSEFISARLRVSDDHTAELTLDYGNGQIWRTQKIPFTDFPLREIQLFAVFNGTAWTHLLTNEY